MKATKIFAILVLALGLAAEVANADFTFGTPTNLGATVNSSSIEWGPSISFDGLELYFWSDRPGGYGNRDIWVTTRTTTEDDWTTPVNLGSTVNTSYRDSMPSISADGLSLFFDSDRPGGYGGTDIYVTTRATINEPWDTPVNLGSTVNSSYAERAPNISANGLELFFHADPPGGYGERDLYVVKRTTVSVPWGTPVNLGPMVNSSANEQAPSISADGRALFFMSSDRPGGFGKYDIWLTRRATTDDLWTEPANLGPTINLSYREATPFISADGSTLFFRDC